MTAENQCRECGAKIPTDSPGGFCPQCLLNLGLAKTEPPSEAESAAPPPASQITTEKAGDRIGRYRLLQEIGHGGCGVVYMAKQEEPVRRKVALKVIKLGMDTRQVVARFEAERQALALMDHPNIARVLDAGATETGRPYFVMELVGGIKITDYCNQNQLTTRQRLDLFIQVCRAIQHAHQKGIIHRDIKPSNVLVATQDGVPVPKVIDFGIAKATQGRLTDETLFTAFEQFLGTPAYMSPEQAQLGSLDVDTRSDIYSLGVLLYELLTGTTPFDTKELVAAGLDEMRRTIREVEPVKPSTRLTQELVAAPRKSAADSTSENGGALPRRRYGQIQELIHSLRGDLDWIVMKCMEKDRARRYETANGLASDIQRHLNNEPVLARPPSKLYEFQKTVRRHKFGFGATAAIIVLLTAGVTVSTWQAVRATKAERVQSRLHQEAQDNLRSAYLSEGRALRFSGLSGRHFDSLAVLSNAAAIRPSLALRNEAIAAMVLRDLRRVGGKDYTKTRQKISVDPSFQRYALSEPTGGVSIRRVADDTVVGRLPDTGSAAVALTAFSPNGKFLSVGYADGRWRIWDWAAAASAVTLVSVWHVDFTSDSKTVGVSDGTSIVLHDLASGERLRQFSLNGLGSSRAPGALEIDPSGQRLALFNTEAGTNVLILDLRTGQTLATLQHASFAWHVAWHPDGRRLAIGCGDKTIHLWDALSGARLRTWPTESCIRVRFDPAGEMLASSGWDGYTRLWDFDRGRQLSAILTSGHLWGFDPEGLRLAHGGWDGVVLEFLEVARGQCLRTLHEAPDARGSGGGEPVMDASGKLLAFRTQEGIKLWDVPTARPLGSDQLHNGKAVIGFDERSEHLILTGPEGLFRSQITKSEAGAVRNLEKPMLVNAECADPSGPRMGWMSADGRVCAIVGNDRCQIFRTDTFAKQAETEVQPGMRFGAINANGSVIASGAWHYGGVRVWDAYTGGLNMKLLVEEEGENTATTVAFSPDDRQVVTATPSGYFFWQVGSWSLFLHIPPQPDGKFLSRMAFSREGKLFAGSYAGNKIRLHDAATGEVLANLEAPDSRTITGLVFSADGCQLFASESADALRVWDLRLIRRQLAEMNLDWNQPPYPARLSASP